jgi:hypothetical protein
MKIVSLVKSKSSTEQITFVTEPEFSVDVATVFSRLKMKDKLLQRFEIKNEAGLLVVRSGTGSKTIAFPPDFQKALDRTLNEAEQIVVRSQLSKEEQERRAQQEREKVIQEAAEAFGVPIIDEVIRPARKLSLD